MFFDSTILQKPDWCLVPPAWSLGAELQAYLFLPLVFYFRSLKIIFSILSLFIFVSACMGFIHSKAYGYVLLPGIFFIFVLGTSIYNTRFKGKDLDLFDKYFPPFVYIMLVFLLIILGVQEQLTARYVREVILGILIGLPIVTYLANTKITLPLNHFFGDLSYGLFLSHFLSIWVVNYFSIIDASVNPYLHIALVFSMSICISFVGLIFVEKRIKKYRYKLFKKTNSC